MNLELDATKNKKYAIDGTKIDVPTWLLHVVTPMSVQSVVATPTLPQSAKNREPSSVPSALASKFMSPVPTPPTIQFPNLVALHTTRNHPCLFNTNPILAIHSFAHKGQCYPLREFQGIEWIAGHLECLTGVHMMNSLEWDADDADEILYTNACPTGMGFWLPCLRVGFQHLVSNSAHNVFYLEALAVLSALAFVVDHSSLRPSRVAIFTDNTNSVNIFHSLHARPPYNPILLTAVDLLLTSNISLRVFYIPGQDNIVADALSHFRNDIAIASVPELHVSFFQPPQLTLGASKK